MKACESETGPAALLVVNTLSLRWREAICVARSSYRVRDSWYLSARCIADGATANVPITLSLRGERLALDWASAPTEELKRILDNLSARGLGDYVKVDYHVIRGLAYYTGIVFEAFDRAGNQSATRT